jgi:hypothetical protein
MWLRSSPSPRRIGNSYRLYNLHYCMLDCFVSISIEIGTDSRMLLLQLRHGSMQLIECNVILRFFFQGPLDLRRTFLVMPTILG